LAGLHAVVTGASSGIGRAIAEAYAAEGAAVLLTHRESPERAREVADAIAADGGRALVRRADLATTGATPLPAGFLGLVVAGTLAAYRSTIETHLNWGTSYLVHDFYRRFLRPGLSEKHYVLIGRLTTAGLMVAAALMTYALGTAKEAFDLILSIGAGTGLLYLLRWFW